jgi:hypothetical protein
VLWKWWCRLRPSVLGGTCVSLLLWIYTWGQTEVRGKYSLISGTTSQQCGSWLTSFGKLNQLLTRLDPTGHGC